MRLRQATLLADARQAIDRLGLSVAAERPTLEREHERLAREWHGLQKAREDIELVQRRSMEEAVEHASVQMEAVLAERFRTTVDREADLELRERELALIESS